MLVFFIHGVATRDVKYADLLQAQLKANFRTRKAPSPYFYSSFWGNALSDVSKMWYQIHQGLEEFEAENPQSDPQDIFRYQEFREGFLSEFVGDMFTYLNPERGYEIRKLLAQQLLAFIQDYPQETDLHIISHSLGTVVLWDILFSHHFQVGDPAFQIRSMIHGFDDVVPESAGKKVWLKSITTMGSPILFCNTMLSIHPATVNAFAAKNGNEKLRWLNILHASDIIAYPLKASLQAGPEDLQIKDIYISTDVNLPGKVARTMGQKELAMALEVHEAHTGYWACSNTAHLITSHLLGSFSKRSILEAVVEFLQRTPGMTDNQLKLAVMDKPLEQISFTDGSGRLVYLVNLAQLHHVYVFDEQETCRFSGYVGWIHSKGLQAAIAQIQERFS